jgi:hypothetical protein
MLKSDVRDTLLIEDFLINPFYEKMLQNELSLPVPEQLPRREKPSPYAFPLSVNKTKPYLGILQQPSEKIFNYRLLWPRRAMENTFGLLASVLRVFRGPLLVNLELSEAETVTALHLHNFLRISDTSKLI